MLTLKKYVNNVSSNLKGYTAGEAKFVIAILLDNFDFKKILNGLRRRQSGTVILTPRINNINDKRQ